MVRGPADSRAGRVGRGRAASRSVPGVLEGGFGRAQPRSSARSNYAQALSVVEFLIAARGVGAITCILARLSEGGGAFDDALRAETGYTEKELFAGWRKWAGV